MKKLIIYVMLVIMGSNFALSQDIYSYPYPRTVDSVYFILSTNWGTVTELDSFTYSFLGENSDTVLVNCYYADWVKTNILEYK